MYIVRWSHECVSMVHADDVDDLSSIISERADLDSVVWGEFAGPLWLDLDLRGTPSVQLADESQRATLRAAERFAMTPQVVAPALALVWSDEGDEDDEDEEFGSDSSEWADAVSLLDMVREQWLACLLACLGEAQLRDALRATLRRLDVIDAPAPAHWS